MSDSYRVVRLLRNQLYPTYQLYAQMANKKTSPQDGLRLAALVTMHWLRRRLGEAAPVEWAELPDIDAYRDVSDEFFPSLHINQGFVVDVVSLLDQGMWTLQITEPDLGSDPGNPEQERPPVPGRIIETNIAFRIAGATLECGFQTVVSDPEGTERQAEVYRIAVVRRLISHPDFGLRQLTALDHDAARLTGVEQVKRLISVWHDAENQLPCVVFSQPIENRAADMPKPLDAIPATVMYKGPVWQGPGGIVAPVSLKTPLSVKAFPLAAAPSAKKQETAKPAAQRLSAEARKAVDPPYDVEDFARHGVSFCRTYLLEDGVFQRFCQLTGLEGTPGDIFILEPDAFGGTGHVLPLKPSKVRQEETLNRLKAEMHAYPLGKDVSFGSIVFLSAARQSLLQSTDEAIRRSEGLGSEWEQKVALLQAEWKSALAERDKEYEALAAQLARQKEYQSRVEREKDELRERHAQELDKLREAIVEEQEENAWLRRKLSQPRQHEEIAAWAETCFAERLVLHPRATSLLSDKSAKIVEIGLICDALDFLATDYWARRYDCLGEDEMLLNCSRKYGRPFEIAPVGERTLQFAPEEYTVDYRDAQGKQVSRALDYHLKTGNDSEYLLRIYFLHDDERRRIVVGSLPRHLRTATMG